MRMDECLNLFCFRGLCLRRLDTVPCRVVTQPCAVRDNLVPNDCAYSLVSPKGKGSVVLASPNAVRRLVSNDMAMLFALKPDALEFDTPLAHVPEERR